MSVPAQRDGPIDELPERARHRERRQVPVDLVVDGDDGREAARPDAGHPFDGERAGRVRVAAVRHVQRAPELGAHLDRAGDVACRAFAHPDGVRAGRREPELPVEGRHAGSLRGRDRARLADPPQGGVREIAIAGLNGLEDRQDRVAAPASGLKYRVDRGGLDRAVSGRPARQKGGQVDSRRPWRRLRAAWRGRPRSGGQRGPVAGRREHPAESSGHAFPPPLGRPEPPQPREEHAEGDEQREPAVAIGVSPSHQLFVLAVPFGLQDLLHLGVGLRLQAQRVDAGLLDGRGVARVRVLRGEPDRTQDGRGRRHDPEPGPPDGDPPRRAHESVIRPDHVRELDLRARASAALNLERAGFIAARAGDAGGPIGPEFLDGAEWAGAGAEAAVHLLVRCDLDVLPGHAREQGEDAAIRAEPAAVGPADEHAADDESAADHQHVERARDAEQADERA